MAASNSSPGRLRSLIQRRPVVAYYTVVFAISVGGGLLVMLPSGFPGPSEFGSGAFWIAIAALMAGPSLAGPILTLAVGGRSGLREYAGRMRKWRVGGRWYAFAVLTIIAWAGIAIFALSMVFHQLTPPIATGGDWVGILIAGLGIGLFGGTLEEMGWTGFAMPQLRRTYSALSTGLIMGFLWGVWHLPITFWASGDSSGTLSWTLFLVPAAFYLAALPAYRILMVWVHDHTGSIFVSILMHAALIFSTLYVFAPTSPALIPGVAYNLTLGAGMWAVVAVIWLRGLHGVAPMPRPVGSPLSPAIPT